MHKHHLKGKRARRQNITNSEISALKLTHFEPAFATVIASPENTTSATPRTTITRRIHCNSPPTQSPSALQWVAWVLLDEAGHNNWITASPIPC